MQTYLHTDTFIEREDVESVRRLPDAVCEGGVPSGLFVERHPYVDHSDAFIHWLFAPPLTITYVSRVAPFYVRHFQGLCRVFHPSRDFRRCVRVYLMHVYVQA